jgi:hypothetical protein
MDFIDHWQDFYLIPAGESRYSYSIMCRVRKYERSSVGNVKLIADSIYKDIYRKSKTAKLGIVKQDDRSVIFSVESITFPNNSKPQSKLFYITRGGWGNFYVSHVNICEAVLSKKFIMAWTEIFNKRFYIS